MYKFLCGPVLNSLENIPRSEIVGFNDHSVYSSEEMPFSFPKWLYLSIPTSNREGSNLSIPSPTLVTACLVIVATLVGVKCTCLITFFFTFPND